MKLVMEMSLTATEKGRYFQTKFSIAKHLIKLNLHIQKLAIKRT